MDSLVMLSNVFLGIVLMAGAIGGIVVMVQSDEEKTYKQAIVFTYIMFVLILIFLGVTPLNGYLR